MLKPADEQPTISLRLSIGWALGSLSMSAMFQATSVLLLKYMVDFVGLAAATAGLLIGASKIYDAVVDPMIGMLSDRTRSRWGRRRPYILLGSIVSAASFWLLFSLPATLPEPAKVGVALVALIANATGYALFVIPYLAMPAEMTTSPKARTSLMGYRISATALGQIVGSFIAPLIIAGAGGGLAGHHAMALFLTVVILALGALCFWLTKDAVQTDYVKAKHYTAIEQVRLAFGNKPFVVLMGVKAANLFGVAILTALTPFFFTRILHESYVNLGYFFLIKAVALFASQPAWVWLSHRVGKKNTFQISSLFYALCTLALLLGHPGTPFVDVMGLGLVTGFFSGGLLLIGQALLPDTIEHDFRRTGLRREGVFSGVYTTIEKGSFAAAAAVLGVVLTSSGYVQPVGHAQEPASALNAIRLCLFLPAIFQAVSSLILVWYRIDAGADLPIAGLADPEELDGGVILPAAAH